MQWGALSGGLLIACLTASPCWAALLEEPSLLIPGDDALSLVQQRAALVEQPVEEAAAAKRPLKVHVTSIGGVGTTGFIEEIRNIRPRILTNDPIDNDQIKHSPFARLRTHGKFRARIPDKFVYLHGDPSRAVLSVDRRGWFFIQARKTRTDDWPHPFPRNLGQYAKFTDDLFQFEKHFDDYYNQCEFPIAFLRISEKTKHIAELAEFLEADVEEVRRALVPWQRVAMAEATAEIQLASEGPEGAPLEAGLLQARSRQLLALSSRQADNLSVVPLEYNPDSHPSNNTYDNISQEVKAGIDAKFVSLRAKYDALPGLALRGPGYNC